MKNPLKSHRLKRFAKSLVKPRVFISAVIIIVPILLCLNGMAFRYLVPKMLQSTKETNLFEIKGSIVGGFTIEGIEGKNIDVLGIEDKREVNERR